MLILVYKLIEFWDETDPIEYFSETRQGFDLPINLNELGFTFAVESIEARIGRIEAVQVRWDGLDGIKHNNQIKLVSCDELAPWGLPLTNEYTSARAR